MARTTAIGGALALAAGLLTLPTAAATAASTATPKPTSPAAAQAPYVAVKHRVVLSAVVKAHAVVSFALHGVRSDATGVVLSVAVPAPTATGSVTVFPYGSKRPGVVNLSFAAKHGATATVVLAPVLGKASLFNDSSQSATIRVVVIGYYALPGGAAGLQAKTDFVPVKAHRLASVVAPAGGSVSFATKGLPTVRNSGVVLSVTVVTPKSSGALDFYPAGGKPGASSFTFAGGRSTTTLLIAEPGSKGRISLVNRSSAPVRVWADVVGYLRTVLTPSPPLDVVGTAQNGGALISWAGSVDSGGSPIASYEIKAAPGGETVTANAAARLASMGGLHNGTAYTFVVVAVNSAGEGTASDPSQPITPFAVPASPTNVVAKASGVGKVTVSWTAATDGGGLPITGAKVTASPGGIGATSTTTSADVVGLTSGQVYTFTAATLTAPSISVPSVPSNAVVAGGTSLASVGLAGQADNVSETDASVSADGRYVAFTSNASNLTADDKNHYADVFVRDRLLDTTTLVSVAATGTTGGDGDSTTPTISADGRYVAFQSAATNLTTTPTAYTNVYVRDLVAGTTTLVSATPTGQPGHFGGDSPRISADGSSVVFASESDDLVPNDTSPDKQIFVATLRPRSMAMVSVSSAGTVGTDNSIYAAISATGRYVAFQSVATNLTGSTTGAHSQVYLRDQVAGTTVMVSAMDAMHGGDDDSIRPSVSADGQYVAFQSLATDLGPYDGNTLQDVYVRDVTTRTTVRVSRPVTGSETDGTNGSGDPMISADGRYVAFDSDATNIVPGDTDMEPDVFRWDSSTGTSTLLSASNTGAASDGYSYLSGISPDGQHVAFFSAADTLVAGDTNGHVDEFVRDLG